MQIREEIELIQQVVTINDVVRRLFPQYWRPAERDYSIICPFHSDTTASLRINLERNKAHCFGGCDRTWNVVELWAEAHQCDLHIAIDSIRANFDFDLTAQIRIRQLAQKGAEPMDDPFEFFWELEAPGSLARSYLNGRGISERTMNQGKVRSSLDRVWFPHYSSDILMSCSSRAHKDDIEPSHTIVQGPLGGWPYGTWCFPPTMIKKTVWITEGAIDTLSIWELGMKAFALRIADVSDPILQFLSEFPRVVIAYDGDDAGRKASKALSRSLNTIVFEFPTHKDQDINEMLVRGTLRRSVYTFRTRHDV